MDLNEIDDEYDYHQEIATSCYGDMLHDEERNEKFGAALKRAIDKVHCRGEKAHVLDIGTGTGLLAMLAVRHGADTVIACEMFRPVADCAKNIILKNGLADRIKVVSKHSTALTVGPDGDLPHRANILVSEVFDTELIGEGALQTFNHAHRVLLEENSFVIPSVGIIYGQVVESPLCLRWNKLEDWAIEGKTEVKIPNCVQTCPGAPSLHDIQLSQLPQSEFKALSPPLLLFRFDFMRQKAIPNYESIKKKCPALASGNTQALFMWWDLLIDDEGEITLSCAPVWHHPAASKVLPKGNPALDIPWRDHWMQAVYFFPKKTEVTVGETLTLRAWHDEFSLWFETGEGGEEKAPICTCGLHLYASRTRLGAINDPNRRLVYSKALIEVSKERKIFVFFGDFSLLPLLIGKLGASKVLVLTTASSAFNEKIWKSFIVYNNLEQIVTVLYNLSSICQELKREIDSKNLLWQDVCILGEPFFQTSLVAWDNAYFWKLATDFLKLIQPFAGLDCVNLFVKRLEIRACCVQFDDLHKIIRPIGNCLGLEMDHFDKMISKSKSIAQKTPEPQPLWEYPCRAESETKTLISYDFTSSTTTGQSAVSFNLDKVSRVDGVAVWADYELMNGATINTGPVKSISLGEYIQWDRYERQGVHLFEDPCFADKTNHVQCLTSYNSQSGNFNFDFNIIK